MLEESWGKVRPILRKVLTVIRDDKNAREDYQALANIRKEGKNLEYATIEGLGNATGNHLFDDYPEKFGITEQEGHELREHFQNYQLREDSSEIEKAHFAEMQTLINEYFPEGLRA